MDNDTSTEKPKHPGGRPPRWESPEQLELDIQGYFNHITRDVPRTHLESVGMVTGDDGKEKEEFKRVPSLNNAGNQIVDIEYIEIPSVLGFCSYTGISRETLCNYESDPEYFDTIKTAKTRIETWKASQLYRKEQVTGVMFDLRNNFGWKDKSELELSGGIERRNEVKELSDDELASISQ